MIARQKFTTLLELSDLTIAELAEQSHVARRVLNDFLAGTGTLRAGELAWTMRTIRNAIAAKCDRLEAALPRRRGVHEEVRSTIPSTLAANARTGIFC